MQEAFHQGGWGMYPTAFVGLVLLAVAVRYSLAPDRRRLFLVRQLGVLVGLTGVLGFLSGVIKTFTSIPLEKPQLAIYGVGESANNLALAVAMLVLARVVTAFGAARDHDSASELVDPRA
jgi:hypothetical protein